jgi:hypothetical protein
MIDVQLQPCPLPMCSWRAHLPPTPVRQLVLGMRRLGFRSAPVTTGCLQFVHDALGTVLWLPATGRLDIQLPCGVPRARRVMAARAIATLVERAMINAAGPSGGGDRSSTPAPS